MYGYIYKIQNLVNGKVYIGQTIQKPSRRKSKHLHALRTKSHDNNYLQNAFNKYKESNFKFTVLNYATDKKTLDQLEEDYIQYYGSLSSNGGYNIRNGGAKGKLSIETREKMSETHKGKKMSLEARKKMSENNRRVWYGKKRSNEDKLKMRVSQRGKSLFGFTGAQLHKTMNFASYLSFFWWLMYCPAKLYNIPPKGGDFKKRTFVKR